MNEEKIEIPDFMKAYHAGCNYEGQAILENMARHCKRDLQDYRMNTWARQQAEHTAIFGNSGKKVDQEFGLASIREGYRRKAFEKAKEHDYNGPEFPEQEKAQATNIKEVQHSLDAEQEKYLRHIQTIRERNAQRKLHPRMT